MATIVKTPAGKWKAVIRKHGWPTASKTFRVQKDALTWARRTEDEMERGVYIDRSHSERLTFDKALSRYTYEQVLAYEVARELINSHIADCSAAIYDEEEATAPDADRIREIGERMSSLIHEREELDMTDDAAVSAVVAKYHRRPRPRGGRAPSRNVRFQTVPGGN